MHISLLLLRSFYYICESQTDLELGYSTQNWSAVLGGVDLKALNTEPSDNVLTNVEDTITNLS